MIHLENVEVREASRVWGDFVEKVAFEVDVNGANILGALVGGYAGTRTYNNIQGNKAEKMNNQKKIENNHYDNIQNILMDLKIVFTPINVIFSVKNQVFEIIKTDEMSPEMKGRFLSKDGEYFKQLLINKMNMELQMAERVFAKQLLQPHVSEHMKQSAFTSALLDKVASRAELEFPESFEKVASSNSFPLSVSLDSLRPFSTFPDFSTPGMVEKVASIFGGYNKTQVESLSPKDMKGSVNVGFLPDRVVFLLNGNLVEQMAVTQMNEGGFNAFKKRDSNFFLNFFHKELQNINNSVMEEVATALPANNMFDDGTNTGQSDEEQLASEEDEDFDKEAATLEEVIESMDRAWIEDLAPERDVMEIFGQHDIHPIVYDYVLDRWIEDDWHLQELEAVLKQIEVTFKLTEPINDRAIDKIATLHTIQNPEHSMFSTSFSFEKFLRAMNNKDLLITTFEGGLEFEEILFALDIAKSVCGDEVFVEFGKNVAPYVSQELFVDNIRYVSDQLYDENNLPEQEFWYEVNDFLARKWKERDTLGLEKEESDMTKQYTELIALAVQHILSTSAEHIDFHSPYSTIRTIVENEGFLNELTNKEGLTKAIVELGSRHIVATLFMEVKREEAQKTAARVEEEWSE